MEKWCLQSFWTVLIIIIIIIIIKSTEKVLHKIKKNRILRGIFPTLKKEYVKGGINMNGGSGNKRGSSSRETKDNGGIHTVPPSQTSSPPRPPKQSNGGK